MYTEYSIARIKDNDENTLRVDPFSSYTADPEDPISETLRAGFKARLRQRRRLAPKDITVLVLERQVSDFVTSTAFPDEPELPGLAADRFPDAPFPEELK